MLRPQVKVDAACAICFDNPSSGKFSPSIAWGLGWGLETNPNENSFWHWGDNGNVKAFVAAFDRSKSAIIIFSNSANGLSIVDEIVGSVKGAKQTALTWLNYEPYNSPAKTLLREILAGDIKAVDEKLLHGKNNPVRKSLTESQINWIGYQLMGRKRYAEAVRVLEVNTANFPKSFNAYDSLGEAYLKAGNTELAIENYQKVVELHPQNQTAANILKRLQPQVKVDGNLLDSYVGRYNAPFGVLSIVRDKERLIGQVSGEPDTIFLPQANNRFIEATRGTQLIFIKDEKGLISHVVIELNGQKIQAERIKG
jgi:tetratricopeptide (TPR) repeat protein